jgi:hypothetical protein
MSKPIFIIRLPQPEAEQDRDYVIEQIMKVAKKLDDYHVLPVIDSYTSEIKFECFNAPHTEMEFKELKRRVLELMK